MEFEPRPDCSYKNDYVYICQYLDEVNDRDEEKAYWRKLVLSDLFFIVYFVLRIKIANHPFVVNVCRKIEDGPRTKTIDIWGRFHFKSTIITIAETIQYHLRHPDFCTCIFSYKKTAAEKFVNSIRRAYESDFLKSCFPDILYDNPSADSPTWSNDYGITLKRSSDSRPQKTIQSSGLVEGMLQGDHFERRIYDDIETDDIKNNPFQLQKCYEKFEMSQNLCTGTEADCYRLVGTFYSHAGPLVKLMELKDIKDELVHSTRIIPVTDNGQEDGTPVFVTQERLDELKTSPFFYSQQLCNPTPQHDLQLDSSLLKKVTEKDLPKKLFKFMLIDSAGDRYTNKGKTDAWGIHVVGVEPVVDNLGSSNLYILDSFVDKMGESEAINLLSAMYLRNGMIDQVGYEKLGNITPAWLYHFQNILQTRGVRLSDSANNLTTLKHKNREKKHRITQALQLPLLNGKIHYLDTIDKKHIEQLKNEMDKHPVWNDDGIDSLAYIYDMLESFGFKYKITIPIDKRNVSKKGYSESWLGI